MADAGAWGPLWYNMYYPDTTELPWPGSYWSLGEPKGYIGDRQTEEQLKAVPDNVKGIFIADTEINNGYPVLKWQKQHRVLSGAGTENDPYLIGDVNDLYTFSEMANTENKYFKLMADIDLDNSIWTPIATEANPFKGDFDGNGHIIKNYRINLVTDKQSYGFFAYTGGKSCIHNLGIENVTAMLYQWHWNEMFGGLVGTMTGEANVRECYAKKVRHELQWDPWPLISSNPEGQGQFHTSGGLIGVLDGGGVEVARCYALDVERDYKTGSGDYEGQIYGYSMFDSGLIGRGEVFRSVTDCYSDTFVVQSKMGTSVSGCWQTLNSGEWYPGYEWRETIADVRYLPWSWSSAYIPGNMYGEGYEKYPRLKWEYDNGKYLNYVKEGRMTKENLSSIFDAENATRQFIWETNRVSIVMYLPYGSHIAYDVNLSADKYYKVSFKARSLNDSRRLNLDFSLGDTDLTELLQDKTIANTWETTAVYVKPSESGIFKLGTVLPNSKESEDGLRVIYSSILPPNSKESPAMLSFRPNARNFGGKVQLTENAKIMYVPLNGQNKDDSEFYVSNELWDLGDLGQEIIEAYQTKGDAIAVDTVIVYIPDDRYWSSHLGEYRTGIVSDKKSEEINDEVCVALYMLDGKRIYSENAEWESSMDIGDYIQYRVDKDNRLLEKPMTVINISERSVTGSNPSGVFGTWNRAFYAKVTEKDGSELKILPFDYEINTNNVQLYSEVLNTSQANIYVYSEDKRKVIEKGSLRDIADYKNSGSGSEVIVVYQGDIAQYILIVKQ